MAIKGMTLPKAQNYLRKVIEHKAAIPFRKYTGGIGHHAQAKLYKAVACRWPEKSCRYVLDLLRNAESNAESKGLEVENLVISHAQVNQAPHLRRRTYRAHGRINAYMSSPCHVEFVFTAKSDNVKKASGGKISKKSSKLSNGDSA